MLNTFDIFLYILIIFYCIYTSMLFLPFTQVHYYYKPTPIYPAVHMGLLLFVLHIPILSRGYQHNCQLSPALY